MFIDLKEKNADISLFVHPNNHPYDSDLIDLGKNDKVIKFYSKDRKKIGALLETPNFYDYLSAKSNLKIVAKITNKNINFYVLLFSNKLESISGKID